MSFVVQKPVYRREENQIQFHFALNEHLFCETLILPPLPAPQSTIAPHFQTLLNLSACVLGTSYFKLLAPKDIAIPLFPLTPLQQQFVLDIYENGMGEFYARNNLSRFGKLQIQVETAPTPSMKDLPAPKANNKSLLLVGGGKDSNVSAQLLQNALCDFTPFAVNPKGPILSSIDAMGKSPLFVKRRLDPAMISLSGKPGFFNGHVPSTAINSMIAAIVATLFDYKNIILSNERSASEPNMFFDGRQVNHQHSKSLHFEKLLGETLQQTTQKHLACFSLLRPLSELKISSIFARTNTFDANFSSCNSNFKQGENGAILWCNSCPKCHFVYLMFAPFMPPERLLAIFGATPLSNTANLASFGALAGLNDQKPWECVGETMEAAAAIHQLFLKSPFQSTPIIKQLAPKLIEKYTGEKLIAVFNDLFIDSKDHCIPRHFVTCLAKG